MKREKINSALKKKLYTGMLRIRIVEEVIAQFYAEQEMRCPTHFSIGQEATPVGVCEALRPEDSILSSHRCHGHYLARGGDLRKMVAELYGKATGSTGGKGGSMHLIDRKVYFIGATSIVGATIPVAVGLAFANKLKARNGVSVAFFGDGATEEGVFYESVNFAALYRLPVLFVCENNFYSVFSPLHVRQPAQRKIYKVAKSLGIGAQQVDGNDVEAVYNAAAAALKPIRMGNGPFLLETMTYRHLEHCGPLCDDALGYREPGELDQWKQKDPVERYERMLLRQSIISKRFAATRRTEYSASAHEAIALAKAAPFPSVLNMDKDVYA